MCIYICVCVCVCAYIYICMYRTRSADLSLKRCACVATLESCDTTKPIVYRSQYIRSHLEEIEHFDKRINCCHSRNAKIF